MVRWGDGNPVAKANSLWRSYEGVSQDALFRQRPIIPYGFRHLKRKDHSFYRYTVRYERRMRSDTGYFIAYQLVEASAIAEIAYANRYVRVPNWWHDYEVPQGYWAELGSVYTYYGTQLFDSESGMWTVFLSEWCVRVAATLLWDVHDMWRLRCLPSTLLELMDQLDYSAPLGHADKNLEVHALLRKIREVDWNLVDTANTSRNMRQPKISRSPGSTHPSSGDYVWINPNTGELCFRADSLAGRRPVWASSARRVTVVPPTYEDLDAKSPFPAYIPSSVMDAHQATTPATLVQVEDPPSSIAHPEVLLPVAKAAEPAPPVETMQMETQEVLPSTAVPVVTTPVSPTCHHCPRHLQHLRW